MFPKAMNFIDCSGNSLAAWLTIIECVIVVIQYGLIAWYWVRFDNLVISKALQGIFILCMICDYLTVILSVDQHTVNFAYTVRTTVFLPLLIAVNTVFLIAAQRKTFQTYDREFLSTFHRTTDEIESLNQFPKRVIMDAILIRVRESKQVIDSLQQNADEALKEATDTETLWSCVAHHLSPYPVEELHPR